MLSINVLFKRLSYRFPNISVLLLAIVMNFEGCTEANIASSKPDGYDAGAIIIASQDSSASHMEDLIRDEIVIDQGSMQGDILMLSVSYSGGCHDHEYRLITSGAFEKTNPLQVTCFLGHNAKNDSCGNNITKTLLFDLIPLKEYYLGWSGDRAGVLIIRIDGYEIDRSDKSMWYEF